APSVQALVRTRSTRPTRQLIPPFPNRGLPTSLGPHEEAITKACFCYRLQTDLQPPFCHRNISTITPTWNNTEKTLAVAEGFEPSDGGYPSHAFEACSLGRSDTPPRRSLPADGRPNPIAASRRTPPAARHTLTPTLPRALLGGA